MSSLPLSVMVHSCYACATRSFTTTLLSGSSPSPTIDPSPRFSLHEIFKHAHLKFMVYGRKHTHAHSQCSHASVGLAQARPNYFVNKIFVISRLITKFMKIWSYTISMCMLLPLHSLVPGRPEHWCCWRVATKNKDTIIKYCLH